MWLCSLYCSSSSWGVVKVGVRRNGDRSRGNWGGRLVALRHLFTSASILIPQTAAPAVTRRPSPHKARPAEPQMVLCNVSTHDKHSTQPPITCVLPLNRSKHSHQVVAADSLGKSQARVQSPEQGQPTRKAIEGDKGRIIKAAITIPAFISLSR